MLMVMPWWWRTPVNASLVREDELTPRLDEWITTLADPEDLAHGQESDPAAGTAYAALQRQLNQANDKAAARITALESGVAVEELGGLSAVLGEASGAKRAQVCASLGLRLDYDPHLRRFKVTAGLSRSAGCVRGGT